MAIETNSQLPCPQATRARLAEAAPDSVFAFDAPPGVAAPAERVAPAAAFPVLLAAATTEGCASDRATSCEVLEEGVFVTEEAAVISPSATGSTSSARMDDTFPPPNTRTTQKTSH